MKKHIYIILAFLITGIATNSVLAQGIEFNHGTWAEIKALAKAKNKLIFVDFYTDWCGPCKHMSMNIFPQKEVGDFYNQNFIAYKVDAEKGEGPALAKQYHVAAYPTLTFINADGEVIHRLTNSTDVKGLIDLGKTALAPQNDYFQLKEKFVKNELGEEDLYRYFLLVKAKGDDKETSEAFVRYFDAIAAVNSKTFELVSSNVNSTDNKAFKYLENHERDFAGLVGKEKIDGYIKRVYMSDFRENVWYKPYKTFAAYETAKADLKAKINLTDKEASDFDTDFYLKAGDEDGFVTTTDKLIKKYYYDDDTHVGNFIGGGSRLVKKEANLLIMKGWAERALAIKDNFINNAQMAMLYKQLKNKTMAVKYIDKSIAQCKQEKNGYDSRAELLKKEIEDAVY